MSKNRNLSDFLSQEVRDFSIYACQRQIPSGIDGMTPSQRKVMFGMQKEHPTSEVKVSIASASLMALSCYHHGSLSGVIVNMAKNYAGTNNLPLLEGIGQFGSRLSPESAAERYIFVKMKPFVKNLFMADDAPILEWLSDDGTMVEPKNYLPLLPMILINGSDGMGTGFASKVLNHAVGDVIDAVKATLHGKDLKPLVPCFNGFTGDVSMNGNQVVVTGCLEVVNSTLIKITQLPIGQYTIKYRDVLNALEDAGTIRSYTDNSNESTTEFLVKVPREVSSKPIPELHKIFKLIYRDTQNFTVWDQNHKIRKFTDANELLKWFVEYRLSMYHFRKEYMLQDMTNQIHQMKEQKRFIEYYRQNGASWHQTPTSQIRQSLIDQKFDDVDGLMGMRLSRLTLDAITELDQKISQMESDFQKLTETPLKKLYLDDLATLKNL
jgi:DNA topoisomerase-2